MRAYIFVNGWVWVCLWMVLHAYFLHLCENVIERIWFLYKSPSHTHTNRKKDTHDYSINRDDVFRPKHWHATDIQSFKLKFHDTIHSYITWYKWKENRKRIMARINLMFDVELIVWFISMLLRPNQILSPFLHEKLDLWLVEVILFLSIWPATCNLESNMFSFQSYAFSNI